MKYRFKDPVPEKEPVAGHCVEGLLLSVTCIHRSERNSFLLLLHLSRWNVPLHSRGGGYQNNLAYIPWITLRSMCIELRGNNDPTEKEKTLRLSSSRAEVFPFPTLQWGSRMIKKAIEREKQSFDAAQLNKPKACLEVWPAPKTPNNKNTDF